MTAPDPNLLSCAARSLRTLIGTACAVVLVSPAPPAAAQGGAPAKFGQDGTVKVRVPRSMVTSQMRSGKGAGGLLVAEYENFALIEVAPAAAPAGDGVEVLDQENLILLNAGAIDTTKAAVKQLRVARGEFAGKAMHLVQFAGPIQAAWYERLTATGVGVVTYIPSNAYLVYGSSAQIARLQAWAGGAPEVQWDGAYTDAHRIDPSALALVNDPAQAGANDLIFSIQLVKDPAANAGTLGVIAAVASGPVLSEWDILNYHNVIVPIPPKLLAAVAAQGDVVSIQPWSMPAKFDERQDQIVAGNLSSGVPTGPGYLAWLASEGFTQAQFAASGFAVDVTDSGIDNGTQMPNHFGLYEGGLFSGAPRVVYNRLQGTPHTGSTLQGCDGHGNLNSHIIGGFDDSPGFPFQDSSGFHYGLGVCPFVRVGSSVIFDPSTYTSPDIPTLQSQAYVGGARISSNSWGNTSGNTYNTLSQTYDVLVRDAQAGAPGNQEMVIVFAAGNSGTSSTALHAPATAKNVITVGAGENVQAFGGSDGSAISDSGANSADDIISFSSRGPTGDGRKKPDICAPGTHVSGGVAQAAQIATGTGAHLACYTGSGVSGGVSSHYFPSTGQEFYTASSGTSHSTPCVAGGCALVRQFFINQGMAPPSPAMTKAFLMNSARYMTGTGAGGNLWSTSQGMGEMNLTDAFSRGTDTPAVLRDEVGADMFTGSGQTRVFAGGIVDNTKPFRVTLAWTDSPGATSGSAAKNNLDLTVTIGGNTYRGNVFSGAFSATGGSADALNNVESVFLPAGTSGTYTVTITAANINSDGVPTVGGSLDQDFALVISNGACVALNVAGNPSPVSACVGGTAAFTAAATGTLPAFQWRKDSNPISGATSSTLTINPVAVTDAGMYDCVITNPCGSQITAGAALTVDSSGITSQPTPQTACVGGPAIFSVGVNNALSLQWRKNLAILPGENGPSLSIATVAPSDAGSYDCLVVTALCGTLTSGTALLTVNTAAAVGTQPLPQSSCIGGMASFTVSATGASPMFQWRKDTVAINGATSATLTINPVAPTDAGSYDCVVTGTCGGTTSNAASLSITPATSLSGQPSPQTACVGGMAAFTVGAPAGSGFQWRKDTVAINGANSATLTINPVSAGNAGSYDCLVTGACGAVTSNAAVLTIPQGVSVTGQPASQSVCEGSPVTLSVTAGGTSPAYQWRKGTQPIGGSTSATLSFAAVTAADAGSYDCVISNACGSATSDAAVLSVCSTVSISGQPSPSTVCRGGSATFSVVAAGSPLNYQWRKSGVAIGGATGSSLTISPAGPADAGSYDCVVSNCCGAPATSNAAALSVCAADYNCSGNVSVQDIFDFLSGWFSGDPHADINGVGGHTVQDVFDFLAAWFQGC